MDKCKHGQGICAECFKEEKRAKVRVKPEPPSRPACTCTLLVAYKDGKPLYASDTDCPQHGIFERYEPAFARKRQTDIRSHAMKQSY